MGVRFGTISQTPPELGLPELITASDVPAGEEWEITIPANTIWLLIAISYTFITSATPATRHSGIIVTIGFSVVEIGQPGSTQLASLIRDYTYFPGLSLGIVGGQINGSLPPRCYLQPGWVLKSNTSNLQIGDDYGVASLIVQRWLVSN